MGVGRTSGMDLKIIMNGMERQVCFEENNEWGGKAGLDLKRILNGMESQVWIGRK